MIAFNILLAYECTHFVKNKRTWKKGLALSTFATSFFDLTKDICDQMSTMISRFSGLTRAGRRR